MKFNRLVYALVVASLVFVASCEKNGPEPAPESRVSLSAVKEDGGKWVDGEKVFVNGIEYALAVESNASIARIDGVVKSDRYCGTYGVPTGASVGETVLAFTVPTVRTASAADFGPMVASGSSETLMFYNTFGRLRLLLTGDKTVTKIEMMAGNGEKISGNASIDLVFPEEPEVVMGADASPALSVDLGDGIALGAAASSVDVCLPAGDYGSLTMIIHDTEDGIMTAALDNVVIVRGSSTTRNIEYVADAEAPVQIACSFEASAGGTLPTWNAGSIISVNGAPALLMSGENTAVGMFGPVAAADAYYAVSPASTFAGLNGSLIKVEIPASYSSEATLASVNPAVAYSTSKELTFKYIAGAGKIRVVGAHSLRSLILQSNGDQRIAGRADVAMNGSDFTVSMAPDASKTATLDCGGGVSIVGGRDFVFVLPVANYDKGFTLILTNIKGQRVSYQIPAANIARNETVSLGNIEWQSGGDAEGNLSIMGWANCYMVHGDGKYSFETTLTDGTAVGNIASADWLWVSKVGESNENLLVSDVRYADGVISFTATANKGNALIAAFDAAGNIVWSWHIWMTDEPAMMDYENSIYKNQEGYFCMDRNLGATSAAINGGVETYGLLYQWGRKDPFICGFECETKETRFANGSSYTVCNTKYAQAKWQSECGTKENGTVAFATANPMYFLAANTTSNGVIWLAEGEFPNYVNSEDEWSLWKPFRKTNYDPCPPGYRVPRNNFFGVLTNSNTIVREPYPGLIFSNSKGEQHWYPLQGYRSAHPQETGALIYGGNSLDLQNRNNSQGFVWTSEIQATRASYSLHIIPPYVYNTTDSDGWGAGLAVRCVDESAE